jgi:hypothetical protein
MADLRRQPLQRLNVCMHLRLWSIHEEAYWDLARSMGRFELDSTHPDAFGADLPEAYQWMRAQVARRIANSSGGWPMWAWPVRPDMRSYAHTPPPGQRLVMLELRVPAESVVLSDYTDWHNVLNNGYHATAAEDADEAFWQSGEWTRRANDQETKVASWERIFELEPGDTVQACIDGPRLEWVKSIRYYKGSGCRPVT